MILTGNVQWIKSTELRSAVRFLFFAYLSAKLTDALKTILFKGLFHDPDQKRAVDTKHLAALCSAFFCFSLTCQQS